MRAVSSTGLPTLLCCGALVVAAVTLTGCPQYGVIDDGSSISFGPSNRGTIINPARVPRRGVGFWSPPRWHKRGLRYGTDEMIALITHVGRHLHSQDRRAVLGVADISRKRGGPSAWLSSAAPAASTISPVSGSIKASPARPSQNSSGANPALMAVGELRPVTCSW